MHLVLNELHARLQARRVFCWRSRHGNAVDFVLAPRGRPPVAIECKRLAADLDPSHLQAFRARYLEGPTWTGPTTGGSESCACGSSGSPGFWAR